MQKKVFGWTGVKVAVIGQGTWKLPATRRSAEALQLGLDLGLTHVDCAEMYNNEEFVGETLAGDRGSVFLASKVLPSHANPDGTLRACEQSLRRLRIDRLDLYLIHWRGSIPLRETMAGLESLVDQGLTRFIGVSNFDVEDLEEAVATLRNHRLACDQVLYHLRDRGIERRLLRWCVERETAIVAYSPFGHSDFPSPRTPEGRALAEIAARHRRTPRQVVLNFLTRHANVFAIPKAGNPEHVRENAGSKGWELSAEDLAPIDRLFPTPDHDVPLGMI